MSPDSASAPSKLLWMDESEPTMLLVGKKDGTVQKWDTSGASASPALSTTLSSTSTVQDLEYHPEHKKVIVAVEEKVVILNSADLSVIREYSMPKGMNFREEGA